ncbi:SOS response-associated peptidase [Inquilinus sp. OTU3971]|uniref:SOS response-associated peptidase n=1 Tax=Inquilinus sp. OTU3971 TaxID=3043855 RepID=UPI00313F27C7
MSPERLQRLTRLRDERNHALGDRSGTVGEGEWCIVLRRNPETGECGWDLLQWGFVPRWAKDRASPHLHARAETVHELPTFGESFAHRRCLIFSDRFIEFRTIGQPKGQEVAFGLATGRSMVVAGIWDAWRNPESGDWLRTFAEITVDANDLVGEMHDRMPAILPQEAWRIWLGQDPATELELRGLLRTFPSELLTCWPAKQKRPPPGTQRRPNEMRKPRGLAPQSPRQGSLL